MPDFMGITGLVEDLGPCRHSTHPKHKAAHRSQLTMDTITHANTHISPFMPIWHVVKQKLCRAVFTVTFGICSDHNIGRKRASLRQEKKKKESEERQEQTNKTNLVKPSAGLGPGLERRRVCVCEAM